jgi:hypothetical protein
MSTAARKQPAKPATRRTMHLIPLLILPPFTAKMYRMNKPENIGYVYVFIGSVEPCFLAGG